MLRSFPVRASATACLAVACVTRPSVTPGSESIHYPIASETFPGGLRTVREVAPDFGTTGVVLLVGAGSAEDPKDEEGLAHLVEHLVLESPRGRSTLRQRLDALGATWNASTTWDRTTFFAFIPTGNFSATLALFADILGDPLASVDETTFEHERQVVRNEMRLRTENGTMGQALGLLAGQVFPKDHPYARLGAGTGPSIDRLTLADAREFARKHYQPSLSVLATSGPLPFDAQRTAVAAFAASRAVGKDGSPASQSARAAKIDPLENPLALSESRELPIATPTLYIGWSIPSGKTPDADVAEVVAEMATGVFWQHIDDRDRDIATVHADTWMGSDADLFYVEATLKEATDPQATARSLIRTMQSGIAESTYGGFTFPAYKQSVATAALAQEETLPSRTINIVTSMWLAGSPIYLRGRADRMVDLTTDRVVEFYRRYLTPERAHVLFARPLSGKGSAGEELASVDTRRSLRELDAEAAPSVADVRSWMREPGIAGATRTRLRNGLEVLVLPLPGSPFHSVLLAYHGGRADERTPGAAVASLWAKEHFSGSGGSWGVSYRSRVGADMSTEFLRAAGSNLELTLRELKNAGDFRVFWPPRSFSSRLQVFQREDDAPENVLERRMSKALYGSHPYGHAATSTEISHVRPNDVTAFLDTVRRPDNGILIIVGDVDPQAAVALATSELESGGATGGGSALSVIAPVEQAAAASGKDRLLVQHSPGSTNAHVTLWCALPKIDAEAYGAAVIFAAAADGLFEHELRERTASSYAPNGRIRLLRGGTTVFEMSADTDYAFLPSALATVDRFLQRPVQTWLGDDNLARARAGAAKSFNLNLSGTRSLSFAIADVWNRGWPVEVLDRYPQAVLAARPADVVALGEHCRDNSIIGLLGDEGRLRAALAARR